VPRFVEVRGTRTFMSRILLAFLTLQVLSGWVILFAIGWCLIEIWRDPQRDRLEVRSTRRRRVGVRAEPIALWHELEFEPARRRRRLGVADGLDVDLRAA